MTTHTPTPWRYEQTKISASVQVLHNGVDIFGNEKGAYICTTLRELEDAKFIVKAVNNYDELIRVLKLAAKELSELETENQAVLMEVRLTIEKSEREL